MEKPAVSLGWRKSSYSANGGAECVEVGAIPWRKSTYSAHGGTDCVEAGDIPGSVLVRDTTQRGTGLVLRVSLRDWAGFTRAIRTSAHPLTTPAPRVGDRQLMWPELIPRGLESWQVLRTD